jgi:hypothetical protein
MPEYHAAFKSLRNEYDRCSDEIINLEWFANKTIDDKYDFYFNLKDFNQYSWLEPDDYHESDDLITRTVLKVTNHLRLNF